MHFWNLELRNSIQELSFVGFIVCFWFFFPPVVAPYISLVAHKVSMLWVLHIIYVMHNSVYYTTIKIADSGNSYTIIWNSTKIELKHIIWDIQTKD